MANSGAMNAKLVKGRRDSCQYSPLKLAAFAVSLAGIERLDFAACMNRERFSLCEPLDGLENRQSVIYSTAPSDDLDARWHCYFYARMVPYDLFRRSLARTSKLCAAPLRL